MDSTLKASFTLEIVKHFGTISQIKEMGLHRDDEAPAPHAEYVAKRDLVNYIKKLYDTDRIQISDVDKINLNYSISINFAIYRR
ncbi:hypothetical protein PSENEW3_00001385 [Picochlorum sp. SENEW3]|nr:hypothetical protein PSENEW3_00001385 [Picochlorum sp. SENEW3]